MALNDAPQGYLPMEEVYNVMTEFMRKLEEIWPDRTCAPSRDLLVSHADTLRLEFAKRAIQDPNKRNPIAVRQDEREKAKEAETAKANQDEWKRRTSMGQTLARHGAGG